MATKKLIIVVKKYKSISSIMNLINADSRVEINCGLVLNNIFSPGCVGLLMLMLLSPFII